MPNKIDFVVTARPSWSRVRSLLKNYTLMAGDKFSTVIFTDTANSRNYGYVSKQVPNEILKVTFNTHFDSDTYDATALNVSSGIEALARYWSNNRPDAALVIADRTETLAVSSTAALMQIPLIHLQGGEVTGSIDNKVRNANSALADFHLTTNEHTASRLESFGIDKETIRIIGCPSLDIVKEVLLKDIDIRDTSELGGVGEDINLDKPFGIVMFHPDTLNNRDTELYLELIIETIKSKRDIQWIWFWPNSDYGSSYISKKMRLYKESNSGKGVKFLVNVQPEVFILLAIKSCFILGNSSFGIREASFLGLPAINIGDRQMGRQRAQNVIDLLGNFEYQDINDAIENSLGVKRYPSSHLYGDGSAGEKGANFLLNWSPELRD